MASLPITLADVEAAASTINGHVVRTPSTLSETLSEILGCTVICKFEIFQFTASFKERGARNRLAALTPEERAAGVVAVSAGNHAQAVARHAALLGIPATIVMPATTPFVKVTRTRHLGADVELWGNTLEEAMDRGREHVAKGRTLVHPYDDPLVAAGQGTVALELLEDHPDLDAIVVPVGGGGLIAGVAVAVAGKARHVAVIGVESESHASLGPLLRGEAPGTGGATLAEGIAVLRPGALAREVAAALDCESMVVGEDDMESGVEMLLEIEKVVVEGAGAAGIAALATHRDRFEGQRVAVILSGGNIDPRTLTAVIERGLVRSGRIARVRVGLDDRPGALAALLAIVAAEGSNVLEVLHQRLFADISIRSADVDVVLECLGAEHRDQVLAAIAATGYECRLLPLES